MTVELKLTVNGSPISTDYFVQSFVDHVVSGMMEALEGTSKIRELNLTIDGESVSINLNGALVPTNAFVKKVIKGTTEGMVSTLKGVGDISNLNIFVRK